MSCFLAGWLLCDEFVYMKGKLKLEICIHTHTHMHTHNTHMYILTNILILTRLNAAVAIDHPCKMAVATIQGCGYYSRTAFIAKWIV